MFGLGSGNDNDAIEVLKRDHDEAERLFDAYEDAKDQADVERKADVAAQACHALAVHARVEEELFYPALRAADADAAELLNEAAVEHATVKNLVEALEGNSADDPLFDATMRVLAEYVKHHVKEEEGEVFPMARKAGIDLESLGQAIVARKQALEREASGGRRSRSTGDTSRAGTPASGGSAGHGRAHKPASSQRH
jgi:hemerythrin superfamily protein